MRRVILVSGPQGAGKSTFCKEIVEHRPEITLIERDAILVELFGQTSLDPYSGDHQCGEVIMWQRVEEALSNHENADMILDTWCGYPISRTRCAQRLRALDVEIVDLWYFVTAEDICLQQYESRETSCLQAQKAGPISVWQRESICSCCRQNFRLFHSMPVEESPSDSEFDNIKFINPCQMTFVPYADLLL